MASLLEAVAGDDPALIRSLSEELGRASEPFAARRMDKSISEALTGVSVDALDQEIGG